MGSIINRKRIDALLADFYEITGLRVGIFDTDFQEVAGYPVKLSAFCSLIRSHPQGLKGCLACDRAAFLQAQALEGVYVYRCHAGLTEAAAPILSRGETIGYLMFGQMRLETNAEEEWGKIERNLKGRPQIEDLEGLRRGFHALPVMEADKVQACARVLQACAVSVWLEECIHFREEALHLRLGRYISDHLTEVLSLETIAQELRVGKTKLCVCTRKQLGMTVGELVRTCRLQRARTLLERTSLPVAAVAEQVGIPDYNYFSKVFRDVMGLTPSAYRRLVQQPPLQKEDPLLSPPRPEC